MGGAAGTFTRAPSSAERGCDLDDRYDERSLLLVPHRHAPAQGMKCCAAGGVWSVLQGYRETRGHFVLLSRDPNIMCLEVLPKHGLSTPAEVDRLRALLDRHTTRV
ncbi:hypothetical protein [Streptomyces sp. 142MFCol3.1]|uniref:hypothetical protein n=1 Tax=Streptomyces sp. 142MFCol3.1 TaxID=1172179 RepID=UPI000423FFDD|nr:hypothetical protein [Streptomyces sp. 142MFCol3.1]